LTIWFYCDVTMMLRAVHKRRPQLGGEEICPVRTFCGQGRGGVLQMRTSAFWEQKNSDFFKFIVSPQGERD